MPNSAARATGSVHAWRRVVLSARHLRALFLGAAVAVAACIAPTLPVPPPAQPDVSSPDGSGTVTIQGGKGAATGGAQLTVWNETYAESAACKADAFCDPGIVRIVNDDGSYAVRIAAHSRDVLYLWQTVGTQTSGQTETRVP